MLVGPIIHVSPPVWRNRARFSSRSLSAMSGNRPSAQDMALSSDHGLHLICLGSANVSKFKVISHQIQRNLVSDYEINI